MVLATSSEIRIYHAHITQLDKDVCLIIPLEMCSVYFDPIGVLEWNSLTSWTDGLVIEELYIIADIHIT